MIFDCRARAVFVKRSEALCICQAFAWLRHTCPELCRSCRPLIGAVCAIQQTGGVIRLVNIIKCDVGHTPEELPGCVCPVLTCTDGSSAAAVTVLCSDILDKSPQDILGQPKNTSSRADGNSLSGQQHVEVGTLDLQPQQVVQTMLELWLLHQAYQLLLPLHQLLAALGHNMALVSELNSALRTLSGSATDKSNSSSKTSNVPALQTVEQVRQAYTPNTSPQDFATLLEVLAAVLSSLQVLISQPAHSRLKSMKQQLQEKQRHPADTLSKADSAPRKVDSQQQLDSPAVLKGLAVYGKQQQAATSPSAVPAAETAPGVTLVVASSAVAVTTAGNTASAECLQQAATNAAEHVEPLQSTASDMLAGLAEDSGSGGEQQEQQLQLVQQLSRQQQEQKAWKQLQQRQPQQQQLQRHEKADKRQPPADNNKQQLPETVPEVTKVAADAAAVVGAAGGRGGPGRMHHVAITVKHAQKLQSASSDDALLAGLAGDCSSGDEQQEQRLQLLQPSQHQEQQKQPQLLLPLLPLQQLAAEQDKVATAQQQHENAANTRQQAEGGAEGGRIQLQQQSPQLEASVLQSPARSCSSPSHPSQPSSSSRTSLSRSSPSSGSSCPSSSSDYSRSRERSPSPLSSSSSPSSRHRSRSPSTCCRGTSCSGPSERRSFSSYSRDESSVESSGDESSPVRRRSAAPSPSSGYSGRRGPCSSTARSSSTMSSSSSSRSRSRSRRRLGSSPTCSYSHSSLSRRERSPSQTSRAFSRRRRNRSPVSSSRRSSSPPRTRTRRQRSGRRRSPSYSPLDESGSLRGCSTAGPSLYESQPPPPPRSAADRARAAVLVKLQMTREAADQLILAAVTDFQQTCGQQTSTCRLGKWLALSRNSSRWTNRFVHATSEALYRDTILEFLGLYPAVFTVERQDRDDYNPLVVLQPGYVYGVLGTKYFQDLLVDYVDGLLRAARQHGGELYLSMAAKRSGSPPLFPRKMYPYRQLFPSFQAFAEATLQERFRIVASGACGTAKKLVPRSEHSARQ